MRLLNELTDLGYILAMVMRYEFIVMYCWWPFMWGVLEMWSWAYCEHAFIFKRKATLQGYGFLITIVLGIFVPIVISLYTMLSAPVYIIGYVIGIELCQIVIWLTWMFAGLFVASVVLEFLQFIQKMWRPKKRALICI